MKQINNITVEYEHVNNTKGLPAIVPVSIAFDNSNIIGFCKVYVSERALKADLNILDSFYSRILPMTPCIGYKMLGSGEIKILSIGLARMGNQDSSIKSIEDQFME